MGAQLNVDQGAHDGEHVHKGLINQWGASMSLLVQASGMDDLSLEEVENKICTKATIK